MLEPSQHQPGLQDASELGQVAATGHVDTVRRLPSSAIPLRVLLVRHERVGEDCLHLRVEFHGATQSRCPAETESPLGMHEEWHYGFRSFGCGRLEHMALIADDHSKGTRTDNTRFDQPSHEVV